MSGHHKIFLGMAAGVGKTYRMLSEGRAEADNGRDVVIGYLEPHDRPETAAQATGLEMLPRLRTDHTDELDLDALLRRRPELALIDELAHTNAPGLRHRKRFEDVDEVLAAGIDVFSTVNVQHLESLNDQVRELTGVRVRETLPDAVLRSGNEVVLIDLTPQALIARLREGKVYPLDRVPAALNGFFKVEHLNALREVALRQVADDVESRRLVLEPAAQAVGEHLLAMVEPGDAGQRVARRAWRSAQRLGASIDLVWVAPPTDEASAERRREVDSLRRLAAQLGAHLNVESSDDPVETVRRLVRERGVTYVLLGTPRPSRWPGRSLIDRLVRALPGVDIRIVADREE